MSGSERARRRGTVFLVVESAEEMALPDRRVDGHWDETPNDDGAAFIEQLPSGLSVGSALAWARQRSPRVLIRNDDATFPMPTGRYFWAGDGEGPFGEEPMP